MNNNLHLKNYIYNHSLKQLFLRSISYIYIKCNIVGSKSTSSVRSTTLFAEGNIVLCPLIENDVLTSLEMMLTASGQTRLCPTDTNKKRNTSQKEVFLFGAANQIRTGDLILTKDVLYHLSHSSKHCRSKPTTQIIIPYRQLFVKVFFVIFRFFVKILRFLNLAVQSN